MDWQHSVNARGKGVKNFSNLHAAPPSFRPCEMERYERQKRLSNPNPKQKAPSRGPNPKNKGTSRLNTFLHTGSRVLRGGNVRREQSRGYGKPTDPWPTKRLPVWGVVTKANQNRAAKNATHGSRRRTAVRGHWKKEKGEGKKGGQHPGETRNFPVASRAHASPKELVGEEKKKDYGGFVRWGGTGGSMQKGRRRTTNPQRGKEGQGHATLRDLCKRKT